jgi:hypothetical protein
MAVRRESVVLDLDDRFTSGMVKAAGATELLNKSLGRLDGKAVGTSRSVSRTSGDIDSVGNSANKAEKSIDKFSGRLSLLLSAAGALGPGLVPIGAVGIPAVAGLASEMGFAAIGAGTMAVAFQGVGDALQKLNKAQLDPTTANIKNATLALQQIGPDAGAFVVHLDHMIPALKQVRDAAAAGLFPGLTAGLDEAVKVLPRVRDIMATVASTVGGLGREVGTSLASDRWAPFLEFIQREAPQAIADLTHTAGNLAHGMASLWMAFTPTNNSFSTWMLDLSQTFDKWATSLSGTSGFQEFLDYLRQTGPQVGATLGAVADALLQIVEAAAPLGGPVLQVLESLAKVIGTIADSPVGPAIMGIVTAMSALNLAQKGYSSFTESAFGARAVSQVKAYGTALTTVASAQERAALSAQQLQQQQAARRGTVLRGLGAAAGVGLVASGAADQIGLTSTATMTLTGAMVGGVPGAVAGGLIGAYQDAAAASDDFNSSLARTRDALRTAPSDVAAMNQALADSQQQYNALADKSRAGITSFAPSPFAIKNAVQGLFGQSEVEKASAQMQAAQTDADNTTRALTGLAQSFGDVGVTTTQSFIPQFEKTTATVEAQQRAFERAKPAMDALGISFDDLKNASPTQFKAFTAAIGAWNSKADSAAGKTEAVRDALAALGNSADDTATQADNLKTALDTLFGSGMNLSQATDTWRAGLRHLKTDLDKTSKSLTANSDAGDKNRAAIRSQVTNLSAYAQALAAAGKDRQAIKVLSEGRDQIIALGTAAGMHKKELEAFLNQLGLTPKVTKATIQLLGVDAARTGVANVRQYLASLDGNTANTYIVTHHIDTRMSTQSQQELVRKADGGYITGPGGPRDDRIPAWLSNGEFVVNAAATARNLDLLHRINAQKFADGGMARSDAYARRYMGASGASSQRMQVNFADLNFTATVRPGGGIDLVGMARAVARQEIDNHESWKASQGITS